MKIKNCIRAKLIFQRIFELLFETGMMCRIFPVTGEFPAQRASDAENTSVWWRYYDGQIYCSWQRVMFRPCTHMSDHVHLVQSENDMMEYVSLSDWPCVISRQNLINSWLTLYIWMVHISMAILSSVIVCRAYCSAILWIKEFLASEWKLHVNNKWISLSNSCNSQYKHSLCYMSTRLDRVECRYNAVQCIKIVNNCRNSGRISVICWIYNRHPKPHPKVDLWGVFCDYFWECWPRYNGTALC